MSSPDRPSLDVAIDGRWHRVPAGLTVAAALDLAGNPPTRRSVSDEPRGPLCGMGSCFECRVTLDGRPHQLACQEVCADGLRIETGSRQTGSRQTGSRQAGAPPRPSVEPYPLPTDRSQNRPRSRPTPSPTQSEAWDVVVVGAGPAGVAAAVHAAEHGRRVVLVDAAHGPGGQIWRRDRSVSGGIAKALRPWIERLRRAEVTILTDTRVVDAQMPSTQGPDRCVLLAESSGTPRRLVTDRLVLATGARERLLPFPGWTLPGVTGAGGLQALLKGGTSVAGRSVVVAGSGPLLLVVAAEVRKRGGRVVALAEQAPWGRVARFTSSLLGRPGKLGELARLAPDLLGIRPRWGTWPVAALGEERLEAVVLRSASGRQRTVPADLLACGWGLVPEVRLGQLLGLSIDAADRLVVDERQETSIPGIFAVGETTGIGGAERSLVEGAVAGLAAAEVTLPGSLRRRRDRQHRFAEALDRTFALRPELAELPDPGTVVCRCEDVAWGQLQDFDDPRQAKLQTRCGMGPCQGRVCGPALEHLLGWRPAPPRSPIEPTSLAVLAQAGDFQKPSRGDDEPRFATRPRTETPTLS